MNKLPREGGILDQGYLEVVAVTACLEAQGERDRRDLEESKRKGGRK